MKRRDIIIGLFAAILLAFAVSPFASGLPDGLERVAEDLGFIEKGEVKPAVSAPLPDYMLPGIKNEGLATAFSGIAGTLLVFASGYGIAKLLRKTK